MAGIGVKLNNIYGKNTLTTDVIGMGYSTVMTIAPMLTVIGALCIMEYFLDFSSVGYVTRELFSCTVLYIFIFALLTASPFNSVLSKLISFAEPATGALVVRYLINPRNRNMVQIVTMKDLILRYT